MTTPFDRRRFLRLVAMGGAGAAVATPWVTGCADDSASPDASPAPRAPRPPDLSVASPAVPARVAADTSERVLVALELDGGNDGLDTVVPYADGRYHDARPTIGLDPESVLAIDDHHGWNPNLARSADRGLAAIVGVGTPEPDLSHFESMRRWREGAPTSTGRASTGFLGRVCDALAGDAPVTGVSVSLGASPALRSDTAVTLSVPDRADRWWLHADDPWTTALRTGLRGLSSTRGGDGTLLGTTRSNLSTAFDFLDAVDDLGERSDTYPVSDLANRLELTARLLGTDAGIRVIHVPVTGFDTHANHRASHDFLLRGIDEALDAFLADLGERGLAERVLVATYSEFGRRPREHSGGTDHGAASVALLAGPVIPGLHGEYPSLGDLDDDDNLRASVGLDTYYATLAEGWFGVPAGEVLDADPRPLGGIFAL